MTSDLHLHPLNHKYYDKHEYGFSEIVLDDEDRQNIESVVNWCYHVRGLDAIALTDHDMVQSGLYAAEYVKRIGMPLEIITGAECTVRDPRAGIGKDEVHLVCLGITELPNYSLYAPMSIEKMIRLMHAQGAFVIMAHPVIYPHSFFDYCHMLDGYEYRNSAKRPFAEGKKHVDTRMYSIRSFNGSDFHYNGDLPDPASPMLQRNYYENSPLLG